MNRPILIVGTSHLAFRLTKKLRARELPFETIPSEEFVEGTLEKSDLEHAREVFERHHAAAAAAVCLLDDSDHQNISLLLAALGTRAPLPHASPSRKEGEKEGVEQHVYVAITNENLVEHIARDRPSVNAFNPHAIAAATFADAIRCEDPRSCPPTAATSDASPARDESAGLLRIDLRLLAKTNRDRIVRNILILFAAAIAGGTLFFRLSEGTSWIHSLYLIATLVSGLNFEDAVVRNYSEQMVIARTLLILTVQVFTLIAFSLIVDYIIKRRTEALEFGRRRYSLRNHVIVCGLGRTGFHIAMELRRRGERVLVIEPNPENRFLQIVRSAGCRVLVGDATLAKNLTDADLAHAAAVVPVINDDLRNLEIGLNARALRGDIRLVLRIFDKEIAEEVKARFNIHFAYSTSSLAAQHLVELLTGTPTSVSPPLQEGEKEGV